MKNDPNHLRCSVRIPLHLPLAVHPEDKPNDAETENISASGVLFHCSTKYRVGSVIQFAILIPASALGSKDDISMECVGRVARCTPVGNRIAIGVIIDDYFISRQALDCKRKNVRSSDKSEPPSPTHRNKAGVPQFV